MPYVVVDTSVALPATLSPSGLARKFWILLVLGALTYEMEHRQLDLDELEREANRTGGRVGGLDTARARMHLAEERRAALVELLPYGAPDDWVALGSAPLFDEYERKLRQKGTELDPALREEDVPRLRRQVEAVCVGGALPFESAPIPAFTKDPADDLVVLSALRAGADYLVSDDRHIVPDGERASYEHGEWSVTAISFGTLMREHLAPLGVDWDAIDGEWLRHAYARLDPDEVLDPSS